MMRWVTTTQVLEELKSPAGQAAWRRFCNRFRPVVVNFARKLGMSAVDAEDAAQEVMAVFVKAFREGKYDRKKGRLSNWLFGIARRVILNLKNRKPLEQLIADKSTGTSFWDLVEDDRDLANSWQTEWRKMVLLECLEKLRMETDEKVFEAFRRYAIAETPVDDVAKELGISRNAVYIAKSRMLSRLGQLEQQFE